VTRDFHIFAQTLIKGVEEEYLSYALKFMTFGNMSQKLWPNILLFYVNGQSKQINKNHFFHKQKFETVFLDLYICEKLLIIPF